MSSPQGETEQARWITGMLCRGQCCLEPDFKEIMSQCFTVIQFVKYLFQNTHKFFLLCPQDSFIAPKSLYSLFCATPSDNPKDD